MTTEDDDRTPEEIEREEVDAYWKDRGNFGVDAGTERKNEEADR